MFELLNCWQMYVDVIYMSEAETHLLETMRKTDMRPDDIAYA